uniref:Uncharacterized protein n=1 Tax=Arundo donax TaxID=35708 RepID=A0A0A9AHJ7_ARUDO
MGSCSASRGVGVGEREREGAAWSRRRCQRTRGG